MKTRMTTLLVATIGIALLAQSAGATEVTLGADRQAMSQMRNNQAFRVTAAYDGYVSAGVTSNYYWRRSLIAFDLTNLAGYDPNIHVITSATLKLTLRYDTTDGPNNTVGIYEVPQVNGDWDLNSDAATMYETLWETSMTELGSHVYPTPPAFDPLGTVTSFTLSGGDLTSMINGWLSGNNAGFALIGYDPPDTSYPTAITEYQVGSQELVVTYATPEPATMAMLGIGGVMMIVRRRRKTA